jgi:hypothetical protein
MALAVTGRPGNHAWGSSGAVQVFRGLLEVMEILGPSLLDREDRNDLYNEFPLILNRRSRIAFERPRE